MRAMTRIIFFTVTVGETATILLFAAGTMPSDATMVMGLFLALGSIALAFNLRWMSRGRAELDAERLLIKSRAGTHAYRWRDISSVQVTSPRPSNAVASLAYHLLGIGTDESVVELGLRRSPRLGLGLRLSGTDIAGIPVPGFKSARLYVQDPVGFARAAQQLIDRSAVGVSGGG